MHTNNLIETKIQAPVPDLTVGPQTYKLDYKNGSLITSINFNHSGNLQSAITRGQVYCNRMRFKFIHVSPFITDLDAMEKKFEGMTGGY